MKKKLLVLGLVATMLFGGISLMSSGSDSGDPPFGMNQSNIIHNC